MNKLHYFTSPIIIAFRISDIVFEGRRLGGEAHEEGKVSELNKSLPNHDVFKKISEILRVFHILALTFLFF